MSPNLWSSHKKGKKHAKGCRHQLGQEYTTSKMAQSKTEKDKNNVAIQGDLNFSIIEPTAAMVSVLKTIDIRSTAPLT